MVKYDWILLSMNCVWQIPLLHFSLRFTDDTLSYNDTMPPYTHRDILVVTSPFIWNIKKEPCNHCHQMMGFYVMLKKVSTWCTNKSFVLQTHCLNNVFFVQPVVLLSNPTILLIICTQFYKVLETSCIQKVLKTSPIQGLGSW